MTESSMLSHVTSRPALEICGMRLEKAAPIDFKLMWSIHRNQQRLDNISYSENPEQREKRAQMLILGRLEQLGTGGFTRVVMASQLLIRACRDPNLDYLAMKCQERVRH